MRKRAPKSVRSTAPRLVKRTAGGERIEVRTEPTVPVSPSADADAAPAAPKRRGRPRGIATRVPEAVVATPPTEPTSTPVVAAAPAPPPVAVPAKVRKPRKKREAQPTPDLSTAPAPPSSSSAARQPATTPERRPRRVLMVASEVVPFAKTGGLADVTSALARALAAIGCDTTIVMPRYRGVAPDARPIGRIEVDLGTRCVAAEVCEQRVGERVRVWFLDQPEFYDREFLYGAGNDDYADNAVRFAFLSKGALACALAQGLEPDVIHAHDWQAGLVPVYLRRHFANTPLASAGTVFTIHNLAYQGLTDPRVMPELGLGWDLFTAEGVEYWGKLSLLKAGINFSDRLTTVSRRYAAEIQGPAGFGFDGIIRRRASVLTGILNGIDDERWDPSRDPYLAQPYSAETLDDKRHARRALLTRLRLPTDDEALARPIVGMVSRMVDQKGLDLIAAIARDLPALGATFVIHGSGEPRYEAMWRELSGVWPDRFGVTIGYDEGLAHQIEAGSDLWLMPSRFEPCGLNQMYSQRYGTLPLVRATGGLDDTVESYDPATGAGSGFKFDAAEPAALLATLRWALSVFHNQEAWRRMQRTAMSKDFSWGPAARAYVETYDLARAMANPAVPV